MSILLIRSLIIAFLGSAMNAYYGGIPDSAACTGFELDLGGGWREYIVLCHSLFSGFFTSLNIFSLSFFEIIISLLLAGVFKFPVEISLTTILSA